MNLNIELLEEKKKVSTKVISFKVFNTWNMALILLTQVYTLV